MSDDFRFEETLEHDIEQPVKPKRRLGRLILVGIAGILLAATLSGFAGYQVGLVQRKQQETTMRIYRAAQQFERGLIDMKAGNFSQAKLRFMSVAELDPNYPGIVEQLSLVEMALSVTATPTPGAPGVVVPSDLKGSEALFNQAGVYLAQKEWAAAIEVMDRLRQEDIHFKTVDVDGMYYIALRNLGVDNMLKNGRLEQGIYNLSIARLYGPIDRDAEGYRNWVAMYKTAASFWKIDWVKMVYWMEQVYNMLPGIRDGSNYTSGERLRVGYIELGNRNFDSHNYCDAAEYYRKAYAIRADDGLNSKHTQAKKDCLASLVTPTETPTPEVAVPTVTPEIIIPTETPTPPM